MLDIGFPEFLLISFVLLIVVGPKDLPIVIKKITGWISSFRGYFNDFKNEITEVENSIDEEISFDKNFLDKENKKNENE